MSGTDTHAARGRMTPVGPLEDHRAGQSVEEETAEYRARLVARGWALARWAGICDRCGDRFLRGSAIRKEPGLGYRAECCGPEVAR